MTCRIAVSGGSAGGRCARKAFWNRSACNPRRPSSRSRDTSRKSASPCHPSLGAAQCASDTQWHDR
eukprot:472149-Alexandrium_andersonii.AAC.1